MTPLARGDVWIWMGFGMLERKNPEAYPSVRRRVFFAKRPKHAKSTHLCARVAQW